MGELSTINYEMQQIAPYLKGNTRLIQLFQTLPVATEQVYELTSEYYATKQYEEYNSRNNIIPHGFYGLLEEDLKTSGVIYTLKKYDREVTLIADFMGMELKDLKTLIMQTKEKKQENATDKVARMKAQAELKEVIRRFTSKFKEDYIKKIIAERKQLLDSHTTKSTKTEIFDYLPIDDYIEQVVRVTPLMRGQLRKIIHDKFNKVVTEDMLETIIRTTFSPNYQEELKNLLGVIDPPLFTYFTDNKHRNRLKNNYEKKLNKQIAHLSETEKKVICQILNYRAKAKRTQTSEDTEEFRNLKALVKKDDLTLTEEISAIMSKCAESEAKLVDGKIVFDIPQVLTPEQYKACLNHKKLLTFIKKIHNIVQTNYHSINTMFDGKDEKYVREEQTSPTINLSAWYKSEKIIRLLGRINIRKIIELEEDNYEVLRSLLIDKGLLWAYISDNIDINTMTKIINSFESIIEYCTIEELTRDNLSEIIKKANLYGFADEVLIGLIGLENIAKIISYNQFSGVNVTDEVISDRLKKVVDLSIRSERMNNSSLPFDCIVQKGNLRLSRYHNNDPEIFTCGIDTKTCFFVSVNENDFFFYSLLNKDGYVVKIVNEKNELVGRASCFRRNNILMINGIRLKNNKVLPENQEDTKQMIEIVEMIKMMAIKMIESTTHNNCPIDYVVCNKAGILENDIFDRQFEIINPVLFREPINIYDEEWQEFVHLYDKADEQLLQEVPYVPNHSFTTDFGEHYPALLIASRNNMGLERPSDISITDEQGIYTRPRMNPVIYLNGELTQDILKRINRIKALSCFLGSKEDIAKKRKEFRLEKSIQTIKRIIIGDDWYILTRDNDEIEVVYANPNQYAINETSKYLRTTNQPSDNIRLYYIPNKKSSK